jgi:hypothetical protein
MTAAAPETGRGGFSAAYGGAASFHTEQQEIYP